jgi:hypothetical protein
MARQHNGSGSGRHSTPIGVFETFVKYRSPVRFGDAISSVSRTIRLYFLKWHRQHSRQHSKHELLRASEMRGG